jgi:hypothetical protein
MERTTTSTTGSALRVKNTIDENTERIVSQSNNNMMHKTADMELDIIYGGSSSKWLDLVRFDGAHYC